MAFGIERRLKRDIFQYALVDRECYEDLGRYEPKEGFLPRLRAELPEDRWRLEKLSIWYNCLPRDVDVPDQGFKIHLASTARHAEEVLDRALPLLAEREVPFKVVVDLNLLDFLNSKNSSRVSSGKFLTVYPADRETCGDLLRLFRERMEGLEGPHILTDRAYRESRVVFYRYGSFRPRTRINLYGEQVPLIWEGDGELVPEVRRPVFRLPPEVEDPFLPPSPAGPHEDDRDGDEGERGDEGETRDGGGVVLRARYRVARSLRHSNSGGVYGAEDLETGREVVVKEARPHTGWSRAHPVDSVAILRKEAEVLDRMADTPHVPEKVDLFQEWQHLFLVEELAPGMTLSSYRALAEVGLLVQRYLTADRLERFTHRFGRIALNLMDALEDFHTHGILLGDLSPNNVLVDLETLDLTFIDFEGAFLDGEQTGVRGTVVTTGFVSPDRLEGALAAPRDDLYAAGCTLYSLVHPVQELFALKPEAREELLASITRDLDLPDDIGEVAFALMAGDTDRAREAALRLCRLRLDDWNPRIEGPVERRRDEIRETIDGVRSHVLATADLAREDRLWPADYRIFTTNPLGLAYGALGQALFLEASGGVPEPILEWIRQRGFDADRYPPGLFVGLAGIAWGLDELGMEERARHALDQALEAPLLTAGPDVFFGMAGVGLACLRLANRWDEPDLVESAARLADRLVEGAERDDEDRLFWTNADGLEYYGFGHGASGVAFFLLRLAMATGEQRFLEAGTRALEHEISRGTREHDYAVWYRSTLNRLLSPYWRHGTAGVGSVLLRYWEALGDSRYLRLAEEAGRYVAAKYVVFPGQFVGLAGMGELLVDLYRSTGEDRWLDEAWRIAEGIHLYRLSRPHGYVFPGEELLRVSTDFGTGSSGIALFLQRLLEPGPRRFYDFDLLRREIAPAVDASEEAVIRS